MTGRESGSAEKLAVLQRAFPPPLSTGVPAADWDAVEKDLGLGLPTSYKQLCDLYGDSPIGEWGEHIDLIAPQARSRKNLFPLAALAHNAQLRERRAEQDEVSIPDFRPWRFHPEPNGLLPWAWKGSQAIFFLVDRDADPDAWRIVAPGADVDGVRTADLRLVEETAATPFLVRLLEAEPAPLPGGSVEDSWARIKAALGSDFPKALAGLRPGAGEDAIHAVEAEVGMTLPEPFRESLRLHDGQDPRKPWLIDGGLLNSLEDLLVEWRYWMKELEAGDLDQFAADARPDAEVRPDQWWRRGWLPIVHSDGDYLILDLDPAPLGRYGQVFAFTRSGPGRVAAPDFAAWLAIWADELERGIVTPGAALGADDDDVDVEDEDDDDEAWPSRTWPF